MNDNTRAIKPITAVGALRDLPQKIKVRWSIARNDAGRRTRTPLYVFGNQKSGTTAIAGLLAELSGRSALLDIQSMTVIERYFLHRGTLSVPMFMSLHRREFDRDIIKEPELTFFIPELRKIEKFEKAIFIVRNPFDNIRSILDRLSLPGDLGPRAVAQIDAQR